VDAQLVFKLKSDGNVESLMLFQNGKEVEGKKIN
jgi:hypothetical protein